MLSQHLYVRGREQEVFYHADGPFIVWGMERAQVTTRDQIIQDWLFLGELKLLLVTISRSVSWASSKSDTMLGLWFFL